jgi:hypothetical protein
VAVASSPNAGTLTVSIVSPYAAGERGQVVHRRGAVLEGVGEVGELVLQLLRLLRVLGVGVGALGGGADREVVLVDRALRLRDRLLVGVELGLRDVDAGLVELVLLVRLVVGCPSGPASCRPFCMSVELLLERRLQPILEELRAELRHQRRLHPAELRRDARLQDLHGLLERADDLLLHVGQLPLDFLQLLLELGLLPAGRGLQLPLQRGDGVLERVLLVEDVARAALRRSSRRPGRSAPARTWSRP